MKALFNSLKYAFRAWEKYIAYIDGLGISWESTQLKPSLIKEELHSELKSHLDNLAMEFKVASYGFRDVELYGEDFRAIFPNIDSIWFWLNFLWNFLLSWFQIVNLTLAKA